MEISSPSWTTFSGASTAASGRSIAWPRASAWWSSRSRAGRCWSRCRASSSATRCGAGPTRWSGRPTLPSFLRENRCPPATNEAARCRCPADRSELEPHPLPHRLGSPSAGLALRDRSNLDPQPHCCTCFECGVENGRCARRSLRPRVRALSKSLPRAFVTLGPRRLGRSVSLQAATPAGKDASFRPAWQGSRP